MAALAFTDEEKQVFNHERFHYPDPHVQRKMEVLWLLSQGLSRAEVARLAAVSTKTVKRYVAAYRRGGIEALKRRASLGPKSLLNQHSATLKEYFQKNPPATIKQAQAAIETLTGIRRSETQVRHFLKRLGMKRRQLATVPGKADSADKLTEQRQFVDTRLNPRLDEAEANIRKVFFVDASHFVHGAFLCCVWCFCRLFLKTPSGRKRFNVLGALDYTTKQLWTVTNTTYITATTVCQLLQLLAAHYSGIPLTLVLDNARYQHCHLVQDLAASLGIELLFLPSYSPNLNLIERLWKLVKKEALYGKYYETFEEFCAGITNCLSQIGTKHRSAIQTLITRNFQFFDRESFLVT